MKEEEGGFSPAAIRTGRRRGGWEADAGRLHTFITEGGKRGDPSSSFQRKPGCFQSEG